MSQGDKKTYTGKQKRQAKHIATSYEEKGVARDEATARAWATVNGSSGGGKKSGSGRNKTLRDIKEMMVVLWAKSAGYLQRMSSGWGCVNDKSKGLGRGA